MIYRFESFLNENKKNDELIQQTLKMIKDQIGLDLTLDDYFTGLKKFKGKKYFDIKLDNQPAYSDIFNKLEKFANKYGLISVEASGAKRASIFIEKPESNL